MRPTSRLLVSSRITLFTRQNCGLCDTAKAVLARVQKTRPFVLQEVDVVQPNAQAWRDIYDYDVPVIHISNTSAPEENPGQAAKAVKLMHRFTPAEVENAMDKVKVMAEKK